MDPLVKLNLKDLDTGITYTTYLSSKDVKRVETDIVYASKVLEDLKTSKGATSSSGLMVPTTLSPNVASEQNAEQDSAFKWSHQAILLFIEEFRKREEDTKSGKISQRRVWDQISEVLRSHGHDVTGPQCQSKFNGMKKTFKSIKDHNSKSGNAPRAWLYIELMESLLGEKPFMKPVAVASSSGVIMKNESSDSSLDGSCSSSSNDTSLRLQKKGHKRKANNIAEAILESRRISEENKFQRYKQTTEQRAKLLEVLDKLTQKLQVMFLD
ncbi:uncharacterized protein LOC112454607 [Temnothorax curvispinosus]|uniref:Uncharacterized protein LOC112454607 n=2 Tax=Temnothorax curvispinosus TaxID=300111 RepID=A0A6J1PRD4_9HYME|nr:uncharacterized protein LOC112454607 [Temnothorax curvispinosus]